MNTTQKDALLEKHNRLQHAAQEVVDGAEAIGDLDHPMCRVEPGLIRTLRRELDGEPQPSVGMFWMSAS
jgi:hypothetical protein